MRADCARRRAASGVGRVVVWTRFEVFAIVRGGRRGRGGSVRSVGRVGVGSEVVVAVAGSSAVAMARSRSWSGSRVEGRGRGRGHMLSRGLHVASRRGVVSARGGGAPCTSAAPSAVSPKTAHH